MKKLLLSIVASFIGLSLSFGQFNTASPSPAFTTNYIFLTAQTTNVVLLTNPCKIAAVQLIGGANATNGFVVNLFDNNATNSTITNAAYTNMVQYSTNLVQTTVSPLTGVTNIYTNTLWFETNILFGTATNNLPYRSFIAPASAIATYNVNMIQSKGIMVSASTNGVVAVTYRIND